MLQLSSPRAGEPCSWPRLGELNLLPDAPECLAAACAAMPPLHPELPSAIGHAVPLRWRNVLCDTAFVALPNEGRSADGDMNALATRWPAWHARLAGFLMHDPPRAQRDQLSQLLANLPPPDPQRTLFDS